MELNEIRARAMEKLVGGDKRMLKDLPPTKRREVLILMGKVEHQGCQQQMQRDLMIYPVLDGFCMWSQEGGSPIVKEIPEVLREMGEILLREEDSLLKRSPMEMSSEELGNALKNIQVNKRIKAPAEKHFKAKVRKDKESEPCTPTDF